MRVFKWKCQSKGGCFAYQCFHHHHLQHVHHDFQPFPWSTVAVHQLNLSRPWAFPLCARHGEPAQAMEEWMEPSDNLYPTNLIFGEAPV